MKKYEYSPWGKELKAQTDIAKKQYQKLDDEKINKRSIPKVYNKSDLICNTNHSFYDYYCNSQKFEKLSPDSKALVLRNFLNDINKFSDLIPRNVLDKYFYE